MYPNRAWRKVDVPGSINEPHPPNVSAGTSLQGMAWRAHGRQRFSIVFNLVEDLTGAFSVLITFLACNLHCTMPTILFSSLLKALFLDHQAIQLELPKVPKSDGLCKPCHLDLKLLWMWAGT